MIRLTAFNFFLFYRPQYASRPKSKAYAGLGAFNLLRREVYRKVGGYRPIALRPDDDLKLGKLVKDAGFRQELALGEDLVEVEWYPSFRTMVHGLEKNAYTAFAFRFSFFIFGYGLMILFYLLPFMGVWLADGWFGRLPFALTALLMMGSYGVLYGRSRSMPLAVLAFPFLMLIFFAVIGRGVGATILRGGLRWRDTLYPLKLLREGKVERWK
jgi:hypothetical protein